MAKNLGDGFHPHASSCRQSSYNHSENGLPDLRLLEGRGYPLFVIYLLVNGMFVYVAVINHQHIKFELIFGQSQVQFGSDGQTNEIRVLVKQVPWLEMHRNGDGTSVKIPNWVRFYKRVITPQYSILTVRRNQLRLHHT